MLITNQDYSLSFSLFKKFPQLVCRMSTRGAGDYSLASKNPQDHLFSYSGGKGIIITMNQTHSSNVEIVNSKNSSNNFQADGLITLDKQFALTVVVADCVPLFLFDPNVQAIGIVHAGWKGTLNNISNNAITKLQDIGSDPKNIYAVIGPHIGGCCYNVESGRADIFRTAFPYSQVVFQTEGKWHVDLGLANKLQLIQSGILASHIDAPISCTSCQNDQFYSFRKDSPETFGKMLGLIGFNL